MMDQFVDLVPKVTKETEDFANETLALKILALLEFNVMTTILPLFIGVVLVQLVIEVMVSNVYLQLVNKGHLLAFK